MIYAAPPQQRLGVMQRILSFIPTDGGLRNILTDPELHKEPPRADNRMNITKAANAYTQKFFGLSVVSYVKRIRKGEAVEPIEVRREVDHRPAPRLRPRLTANNVRCWHRPLGEGPHNASQVAADYARLDAIVAQVG
jgi:hypothetical protein